MNMIWRSYPKKKFFCIMLTLSFSLMSNTAQAELSRVGLRYGKSFQDTDFYQYDLFVSMGLPWQTEVPWGWVLRSEVDGLLSVLTWDGDTAVKPSIMPNLVLSSPGRRVDLIAGLGAGYMFGETDFGDISDQQNLGGPFFLQGQVGFRLNVTDGIFLGYRFYHQSNAGLYTENDSVNINQLEFGWNY